MELEKVYELAADLGSWMSRDRLEKLFELTTEIGRHGVPGDFVELGVANGSSACVLAHVAQQFGRRLILFDSFAGLPAPSVVDGEQAVGKTGKCLGDKNVVKWMLRRVAPNLEWDIRHGWFADEIPHYLFYRRPVAFLHLDGDWYESTKVGLTLTERMSGGVVVVDDYGHWKGCQQAVDEWIYSWQERNGKLIMLHFNGPTQAYFTI